MNRQIITSMSGTEVDGHGSDDFQRGDYSKGSANMAGKDKMKSSSSPAPWAKGGPPSVGSSTSGTQKPGQSASVGRSSEKFVPGGKPSVGTSSSGTQKPGQSASEGSSAGKFAAGGGGRTSGKQQSLVAAAGRVRPT